MEDSKLEYCVIEVKTYEDLRSISTDSDGEGVFVDGEWYLNEMEAFMPADRRINVLKEFDYYVYQAPTTEEYRIQAGMVLKELHNIPRPAEWVLEPGIPQAGRMPEPEPVVAVNPFEGAETIYKKKPKSKNVYPIEIGDLCLVNSLSIPQTVTGIINDGDGFKVQLTDSTTVFKSTEVFPLYALDKAKLNNNLELGDVILTSNWGYVLLTSAELIENAIKHKYTNVFRHTDPNNSMIPRETIKRYQGGEFVDSSGKKMTTAEVEKEDGNRFKPVYVDVNTSFELELIAKHYGITVDKVKPKEVQILKTLEVLLDHPDCVKDKEWACIIGPSGSGKTTVAVEYAESKGLEYSVIPMTAQVTTMDLMGYKSITDGTYFPSLLRDAVEFGKVLILDELDAGNTNSLICLNELKRSEVQFPDKIVKVHPDFRLIATANTLSYSEDYNGRSPLDRATLKRFSLLFYDLTKAEVAIRYGFEDTKDLVQKMTDKKAYSTSDYTLVHDCILRPANDFDPRDIQRIVRDKRLEKEGNFNF